MAQQTTDAMDEVTTERSPRTLLPAGDDGDDTADADVIVTSDTYTNRYGNERRLLDGDTYEILSDNEGCDGMKWEMDWDLAHCTYDGEANRGEGSWACDDTPEAIQNVVTTLRRRGYTVRSEAGDDGDDGRDDVPPLFERAAAATRQGDTVVVRYERKTSGNVGVNAGTVTRTGGDFIRFMNQKDDANSEGAPRLIRGGEYGGNALYTATGSHSPYMGEVLSVTILPADD